MNRIVLGITLAVVSVGALALEVVNIGNLRITCPNSCVQTRSGDNITIVDSGGAGIIIERTDSGGPIEP